MLPLFARMFFRVHERLLGRRTFRILRDLQESQWWPDERIKELQLKRLQDLVACAYEQTEYWRRLMDDNHILPADMQSLDDLRRFPLLAKPTLRTHRENMVARGGGSRLWLVRTSGSTNEALQFYSNPDREAHINAARIRGHEWIGIRRGEKEMYFWGSPVELSKQDRVKRVRDWLVNDGLTNGLELSPDRVREYFGQWKRWRPRCIFSYPCSLVLAARMAAQQGIRLADLARYGLKVICTTSEMLTDVDRTTIAEAFGVPVHDSYGLREGGLVGHECENGAMHCVDEQMILETIDPTTCEPTGGEGELVMTSLVSRVMPIIRYRTGDIVTLSRQPCRCGRTLSSIKISGGRIADFLVTTDGRWVPGYALIYICRGVPGVVKFQAEQATAGRVHVRVETDGDFPADGPERVRDALEARLKSDDHVTVEVVDDIRPSPSGKYRPVVGKLAEQLQRQAGIAREIQHGAGGEDHRDL